MKREVELPEEGTVAEDGKSVEVPGGTVVKSGNGAPEITVGEKGGIVYEDGSVKVPEDGSIELGEYTVTFPEGGTAEVGDDGTVTVPAGSVIEKDGEEPITVPEDSVAVYDPKTGGFTIEEPSKPGITPGGTPDSGSVTVDSDSGENAPHVSVNEDSAAKLKEEVIAEHLTDEEREAIANGASLEIILSVEIAEATVSGEDKQSTEAIIADTEYTVGQYLSIELLKLINGELSDRITELKTPISITIEIPEELRGENRAFAIVRVHDGKAEILEDQDNDPNTITILTDKFSTYAIVYQDNAGTGEDNPNTGAVLVVAPFIAAAAGAILSKKRKH